MKKHIKKLLILSILSLGLQDVTPIIKAQTIDMNLHSPIKLIKSYPYNIALYTEGIQVINNNVILSTGLYGVSQIGVLNLTTGNVSNSKFLPTEYFAEGLTYDGKNIWQLTWKEHTAFLRNADTFDEIKRFSYEGEGWGLCFDGTYLVMSNGTNQLIYRDKTDFHIIKTIDVNLDNLKNLQMNELEYHDGYIYANIYKTYDIIKIDPNTGQVVKVYDASVLLNDASFAEYDENIYGIMNGIAHVKGNTFLLSGKNWARIFEVELN